MSLVFGTGGISKKKKMLILRRDASKLFEDPSVWMLCFRSVSKCSFDGGKFVFT